MTILGIESSCDETATAVFDPERGLLGEWLQSQVALHERHGGVVPDLAAREHLKHLAPLIALAARHGPPNEIAVTYGPGLAPCLTLGIAAAKALACRGSAVRLLGVSHLRGHVWSVFLPVHAAAPAGFDSSLTPLFPHLALIVSGGHTLLCRAKLDRSVEVLSSTRDDAAGEALDKGAKLLGLGYPGGPLIEEQARQGNPKGFDFPRALERRGELDFSFSGLKTSLRYTLERLGPAEATSRMRDLCASYQEAVVDALVSKTERALEEKGRFKSLGLSGGVAKNRLLRARMEQLAARHRLRFLPVLPEHAGDNAAMIAFAAWFDPGAANPAGIALSPEPSLSL
jgi:N6-L-threonylcarbamoyladenine synthase